MRLKLTASKPLLKCSVSSLGRVGGGQQFWQFHLLNKMCTSNVDVSMVILV